MMNEMLMFLDCFRLHSSRLTNRSKGALLDRVQASLFSVQAKVRLLMLISQHRKSFLLFNNYVCLHVLKIRVFFFFPSLLCEIINGFYSLFDFSFPCTSANLVQLLLPQPFFPASFHVLVNKNCRHNSYADVLCE